jgi:hypothetical protein
LLLVLLESGTTFLRDDGTWSVPAGSGDVSKVGTPVDNQVAVWTGDGTVEGDANFTWNGTALAVGGNITVTGTVDGVDVGALKTDVDGFNDELKNLSTAEIDYLEALYATGVTDTEYDYLDGVTSNIQTQLNGKQATLTFGIADDNAVEIDSASVASGEIARFTANGLESRSDSEMKTQLGYMTDLSDDTTPTAGGTIVMNDNNITGAGSIGFTQELDNGSKTASFSIDFGTDQKQKVTLTANTMTLTLDTTFDRVGNYVLKIVNGGTATLTWASETGSIYWAGGTAPTLTSSGTDIVSFYYDGTNWYGVASLNFS